MLHTQALYLVSKLGDDLESNYIPTDQSTRKKRKKVDSTVSVTLAPPRLASLPFVIRILIICVKHVNISQPPNKMADETSMRIGNNVLCSLLVALKDADKDHMVVNAVLAILRLHECLLEWSDKYWASFVGGNPVDTVIALVPEHLDVGEVKVFKVCVFGQYQ